MGKMSEIAAGIDDSNIIIDEILEFLYGRKLNDSSKSITKDFINFFNYVKESINTNWDEIDFVYKTLGPIQSIIVSSVHENATDDERVRIELEIWNKIITAKNIYHQKYGQDVNDNISQKAVNSETYYSEKISELESKKEELEKKLDSTKGDLDNKSEQTLKLENQTKNIKKELENLKHKLELRKKDDDAKRDWEEKIKSTFTSLKGYLKPVTDEQKRLKILFVFYSVLAFLLVSLIVFIEHKAIGKITSLKELPTLKEYLEVFLPLPVAGGLLWGFIFQMNRAQRQLVVLAKSIHSVEYVQGLLLAINNLSPSIEDAIIRINSALDKLIDNHLSQEDVSTESGLVKEENKDSLPIDSVLKILKEAKGFVKT